MIRIPRWRSLSIAMAATIAPTSLWAQCAITPPIDIATDTALQNPAIAGSALAGAIANINTAFLTQQGSAFVSAPSNPAPNQPGGGVWVRGVGGEVTVKSTATAPSTITLPSGGVIAQSTNCNIAQRYDFAGGQAGTDIARLNWDGWNVHLGATAGYLGSRSTDNGFGFSNKFDVPFIGTYLVATKGRFFADILLRQEFYNVTLNNPGRLFFDQPISAHGTSVSASAGYNFALNNNWFIEPSAGFIYSRTSVDDFTAAGVAPNALSGTIRTSDITSAIGRASLRVGTTVATPNVVWQPFASASVFHEFAGNVNTSFANLPGTGFLSGPGGGPVSYAQTASISRIGTYGQYSLGLAGQVVNTGWLGFVRIDYRNGERLEGWTGNAGLRYQFTPGAMDALAADMPMKVKAPRIVTATNWTGLYVGGFFGVDYGRTRVEFLNVATPTSTNPWVFGPLGGAQIGYNWHGASNWVIGVEGDIGAANVKGSRRCGADPALTGTIGTGTGTPSGALASAFFNCRENTDWVATATARVGYSWDRTLYYVRGGAAFEDSTVSANCILGPTGVVTSGTFGLNRACTNQAGVVQTAITTGSQTRTGWLLGFGTEFDLGRGWSAKSEYNFIDFGRHTAVASDGVSVLRDRAYTSQVKVGVNYRFGGPIVARY